MSVWLDLEKWIPTPGSDRTQREFSRVTVEDDGIDVRVRCWYVRCTECARRATRGEAHDASTVLLCDGVGHAIGVAGEPLCKGPPR